MTTFALLVVLFLQGGVVVAESAATSNATLEDCRTAGADLVQKFQGQKIKTEDGGEGLIVLDAQAFCIKVTKQDHA